jgi:hypothetical protein
MTLRQRQEPIRSRKYLDGARGETCKLRFVGICNNDRDTVVACHIHNASFGLSRKADDFSVIDGCANCHRFLDTEAHKISRALLLEHILRGLQETLRSRIDSGLLFLQLDAPKPSRERPVKARKPRADRAPIAQRADPWPTQKRTINSRNNLRKSEADA